MDALIEITQDGRGTGNRVELRLGDDGVWPAEPPASDTVATEAGAVDPGAGDAGVGGPVAVAPAAILEFLHGNAESQGFTDIGLRLGRLLLPPTVRQCWARAAVERTFLCLDPELRRLPWECARSPHALFVQPDHPFVRVHRRVVGDDPVTDP
ncbi:hypothetical protein AB0G02_40090, partial [Actinosynnema sp. NPDC023658]|uniref:hypothetical protein n=1 Tax=Actinosynnema sp. NPDC023658 TaxID=3155465 RepID=UPI0033E0F5A7